MAQIRYVEWQDYAEVFAFFGNSLLGTIRRTPKVGLLESFWHDFPAFGSKEVGAARGAMEAYVASLGESEDSITEVSAEYTHLFVGPPKPAAAPWETFYRDGGSEVGFGKPTFEMRELLRSAGLELKNVNNQYEDHMGIELLSLSVFCTRVTQGNVSDAVPVEPEDVLHFIEDHPLAWIDAFCEEVAAAAPGGYYDHLLAVTSASLKALHTELAG